jgi:hypothetical protein
MRTADARRIPPMGSQWIGWNTVALRPCDSSPERPARLNPMLPLRYPRTAAPDGHRASTPTVRVLKTRTPTWPGGSSACVAASDRHACAHGRRAGGRDSARVTPAQRIPSPSATWPRCRALPVACPELCTLAPSPIRFGGAAQGGNVRGSSLAPSPNRRRPSCPSPRLRARTRSGAPPSHPRMGPTSVGVPREEEHHFSSPGS